MRITINLSRALLKKVFSETGADTTTHAIQSALKSYVNHRQRLRLIKSFGKFPDWEPNLQAMRADR